MALLDKAGKVQAAPAVEFFADPLSISTIGKQQARHDGKPDQWRAYIDMLDHATSSATLPFKIEQAFTKEILQVFRQKLIHRADYAAWLQSIGEPPPAWWILEGETVTHACEGEGEQTKRGRGRPRNPMALSNREDELREDAIAAARQIGGNPQVQTVALHLHKSEKYKRWGFNTLKRALRKTDWQSIQKSQK